MAASLARSRVYTTNTENAHKKKNIYSTTMLKAHSIVQLEIKSHPSFVKSLEAKTIYHHYYFASVVFFAKVREQMLSGSHSLVPVKDLSGWQENPAWDFFFAPVSNHMKVFSGILKTSQRNSAILGSSRVHVSAQTHGWKQARPSTGRLNALARWRLFLNKYINE